MKVMLIAEELPRRHVSGALTYLLYFIEYCAARRLDLTILVTGHRFERLLLRPARLYPGMRIRLRGPDLIRIGPWALVVGLRAWRHAMFSWLMQRGPRRLHALWLSVRRASQRDLTLIGRRLEVAEAQRAAPMLEAEQPNVILINTVFAAAILDVKPRTARAALIAHDVMHKRTQTLEALGLRVMPAVRETEERAVARRVDAIIAISESDAADFRRLAPQTPTVVVMPPPVARGSGVRRPDPKHCAFIGSGTVHNVDGIQWFLARIWPRVLESEPDARLELIGAICERIDARAPALILHHRVDDVAGALARASFAVNPLRAGSGLKIKMLDYFAQDLPTITTAIGAEGLPPDAAPPFLVYDAEASFADAMIGWLRDPAEVARYAARCAPYAGRFSREAGFAALDRVLALDAVGTTGSGVC